MHGENSCSFCQAACLPALSTAAVEGKGNPALWVLSTGAGLSLGRVWERIGCCEVGSVGSTGLVLLLK